MSDQYAVSVAIDDAFAECVAEGHLMRVAESALCAERVALGASLTVVITDDEQMAELNLQYRGMDGPTDVLSFAMQEG